MAYRRSKKNKKGILIVKQKIRSIFKFRKKKTVTWQNPKSFTKHKSFFVRKYHNFNKIIIFLVIFLFVYLIFFSNFFLINQIYIKGNVIISNEKIEEIIKKDNIKPILAIFPRNNFFLSNEKAIEENITNEFSEIKNIIIKKKFPNKIEIEITEKNPLIIWCRLENCFYIDSEAIAFMPENNMKINNDQKLIKIIEEIEIEEEIKNIKNNNFENLIKNEEEIDKKDNQTEDGENEKSLLQIKINDKVADSDFILFILNLNDNIEKQTDLEIKYYKTKGVKTREIIAYTNKNTRIYFNAIDDVEEQSIYLREFLSKGLDKNEINTLEYIYLKSGNKIFYK